MPLRSATAPDKRVSLLEELLAGGTWTYSVQTRDIYWSPGLFTLLGLNPNTVMASRELYHTLIHPEDRLSHDEIIERAEAGLVAIRRFRVIRPDGRMLWLESRSQKQFDRQGRLSFLHGVVQDVSERERTRAEVVRLQTAFSSVKLISGAEFWRTDAEGRLIDTANWSRMTGESADRLRDHVELPAIHPDDREIIRAARAEGIRLRSAVEFTARVKQTNGEYASVDHKLIPILGEDGSLVEWHGMSWVKRQSSEKEGRPANPRAAHVRAARTLLGMTALELAEAAGVSFSTIRRIEDDAISSKSTGSQKVSRELARRGIRFTARSGGGLMIELDPSG